MDMRDKIFPEEWKEVRLGDYLEKYTQRRPSDSGLPILTSSRNGLMLQKDYYANNEIRVSENSEYGVLPRGYFTYRHMSDDLTFKFNINNIANIGLISPEYPVFTTKGINNYFLLMKLNHGDEFKKYAIQQKKGSTRTRMYFSVLEDMRVILPPLSEQNKIADILLAQDKVIELKEKLLVEKKRQKKYLMQVLLDPDSPHFRRLPGFDGEWMKAKLKKIALQIVAGGTPSTKYKDYWNGEIPWMSSGEVNNRYIFSTDRYITEKGYENSSTKLIPANSVIIALAGQGKTRGKVAINKIQLCTNQSLSAVVCSSKTHYRYLFYDLESQYEKLRKLSTGDGGRGGLNLQIIRNLKVWLPDITEQKRIAEIFYKEDKLIDILQKEIAEQKQKKKALMQMLLTGKVRVKV